MASKLNPNSLPFPSFKPKSTIASPHASEPSSRSTSGSNLPQTKLEAASPHSDNSKNPADITSGSDTSENTVQTPSSQNGFPYTVVFPCATEQESPDTFPHKSTSPSTYQGYTPPAKSFGQGWLSSSLNAASFSSTTAAHHLTPPNLPQYQHHEGPIRGRSPSLPGTQVEARQAGWRGSLPLTARSPHAFGSQYEGADQGRGPISPLNLAPIDTYSMSGMNDLNPRRFPSSLRTFDNVPSRMFGNSHTLNHFPSVPSLTTATTSTSAYGPNHGEIQQPRPALAAGSRRNSGQVVRWLDELELGKSPEEDNADYERRFQLERSKLGSRSMSVLQSSTSGRNVYIPQIEASASKEALKQYAQSFGHVLSLRLDQNATNPASGSRAFVLFSKAEEAVGFMNSLIHQGIACEYGKCMELTKQEDWQTYYKSLEDPNSSNLYIQGFLPNDSEDFVKEVLRPGVVSSAKWLTDDQGRLRGTILARMQSRAQADEVISSLDGKFVHPISGERLQVRIADSEAQKQWKKQMKVVEQEQQFTSRRASVPSHLSREYFGLEDDQELEQERLQYLQKARELEERLAAKRSSLSLRSQQSFSSHGTPRTPMTPGSLRQRVSSSSFHCGNGGYDSARPQSFSDMSNWSSRQGQMPGWDTDLLPPTPGSGSRPRFDFHQPHNFDLSPQGILHHAQSSPELRKVENPAKLLWPTEE